jgi:hypothetical protein
MAACADCTRPDACRLWGCARFVRHPDAIEVPPPAAPLTLPRNPLDMSDTSIPPRPAPPPTAKPAPNLRAGRLWIVREVANGFVATPFAAGTVLIEAVALTPEGLADLARAWADDR